MRDYSLRGQDDVKNTHRHTNTCVYFIGTYVHTYVHTRTHTHQCLRAHIYTYRVVTTWLGKNAWKRCKELSTHTGMHAYIHVYVCTCLHVYIHTNAYVHKYTRTGWFQPGWVRMRGSAAMSLAWKRHFENIHRWVDVCMYVCICIMLIHVCMCV